MFVAAPKPGLAEPLANDLKSPALTDAARLPIFNASDEVAALLSA